MLRLGFRLATQAAGLFQYTNAPIHPCACCAHTCGAWASALPRDSTPIHSSEPIHQRTSTPVRLLRAHLRRLGVRLAARAPELLVQGGEGHGLRHGLRSSVVQDVQHPPLHLGGGVRLVFRGLGAGKPHRVGFTIYPPMCAKEGEATWCVLHHARCVCALEGLGAEGVPARWAALEAGGGGRKANGACSKEVRASHEPRACEASKISSAVGGGGAGEAAALAERAVSVIWVGEQDGALHEGR